MDVRSTFLPRVVGVLMAVAGIGCLTFGVLSLLSCAPGAVFPPSSLPAYSARER